MKLAIASHQGPLLGSFLDALARSALALGHEVSRDPARHAFDPGVLSIVWNGRHHRSRGPTLYCEHGWLPRWAYQVSPRGINADSHLAPFVWSGQALDEASGQQLDQALARIREAPPPGLESLQTNRDELDGLRQDFLLVALQIESDTNIMRHAPASLRSMQALVDAVSAAAPPWPVIFKQHPADARHGHAHLRLKLRRPQDALWPHVRGNVYQMLKSPRCRGVLTINSNVAHDALLWNVPAVVLGRNVWPAQGAVLPLQVGLPARWQAWADSLQDPAVQACRRAYAWHLIQGQWTLEDAASPQRVAALLASAWDGRSTPAQTLAVPAPVKNPATAPTRLPPRRPVLPAARRPAAPAPIDVVATDRGWHFELLKRQLVAASTPARPVVASEQPLPDAGAWIFLRAREAIASPDPARTLVQLHDLLDHGLYRPGGERRVVADCGALALSHPDQRALLAASGIDLAHHRLIERPPGWSSDCVLRTTLPERPTVVWLGRPERHHGVEVQRLDWFIESVRPLRADVHVLLAGERLEPAARQLVAAGLRCRCLSLRALPLHRHPWLLAQADAAVVTADATALPWTPFEALACGVPLVATPTGWSAGLVDAGRTGLLAGDPAALSEALQAVLAQRARWFERRATLREQVAEHTRAAWIAANLAAAQQLAQRPGQAAA